MKNKTREVISLVKDSNMHYEDYQESMDRKLKYANNTRIANELYKDGIMWFNSGKSLNEATEVIKFNDAMVAKKDIIHFQRGFQAGIKEVGFNYGYNDTKFDDIPDEYIEDRYFLEGYKKGYEQLQREINKQKKTK